MNGMSLKSKVIDQKFNHKVKNKSTKILVEIFYPDHQNPPIST